MMVLLLLAILSVVGVDASVTSFDAILPRQTGSAGGCETYVVQTGDTCRSIARASNSTYAQIVSWNYGVASLCSYVQGTSTGPQNLVGHYSNRINL